MKWTGFDEFKEQTPRRRDTGTGAYLVRAWVGPATELTAFLSSGLPAGWMEREYSTQDGVSRVEATYAVESESGSSLGSTPDPILRQWSLLGNTVQKSVWQHPAVQDAFDGLSVVDAQILRDAIKRYLDGDTSITGFTDPAILQLAVHLAKGRDEYTTSQYVLRKSEMVIYASALKASHENVNVVFDSTGLRNHEPSLPAAALIDLTGLDDLLWKKQVPNVEPGTNGRWVITQEYWSHDHHDEWVDNGAIITS